MKSAEVVQGLQIKDVREGGRQLNREVLEECRGCAWLTGKRRKRMGRQPTTEHLESAEVVHGLQVKGAREEGCQRYREVHGED